MKKALLTIVFLTATWAMTAQLDEYSLMGMPTGTTAEMNAITGMTVGQSMYNTTENAVYIYTGAAWVRETDDQDASEVNSDTPVDVDGDGNAEPTVEEVIQDIAPITSASGRIFYPPSIAIDASTLGAATVDLYVQYTSQFSTPVASSEAVAIPVYDRTDLYYYVTYADPTVFGNGTAVQNMTVNTNGVLSYEIFAQPADYNALINVVFVVK